MTNPNQLPKDENENNFPALQENNDINPTETLESPSSLFEEKLRGDLISNRIEEQLLMILITKKNRTQTEAPSKIVANGTPLSLKTSEDPINAAIEFTRMHGGITHIGNNINTSYSHCLHPDSILKDESGHTIPTKNTLLHRGVDPESIQTIE
jgi:hypothetical protein